MRVLYDDIGINYSSNRRTDSRIEEQLHAQLKGAKRIINIGAGTGSYEPKHIELVAVEPSSEMIAQRKEGSHPSVQAFVEALPFENNSFTHGMAILSMHHWKDKERAFKEINRVVTDRFVVLTWNPDAEPFWLTRDYFPEFHITDQSIFPSVDELKNYFEKVEVSPLLIPEDCQDGFMAAYWKRPEAYLNKKIRQSISAFSKITDPTTGLKQLEDDLTSGKWREKNQAILSQNVLDAGYVIITAEVKVKIDANHLQIY
ncbi:MAG: class I SAM-dependent methyltransferase [Bacteroidota bacterium]